MAILDAIAAACKYIGLAVPESVYGQTDRELVELASYANEVARIIAYDGHDWTKLKAYATLTGDGIVEGFDLSDDYKRMLKKARVWSSAMPYSPLTHYPDIDQWLGFEVQTYSPVLGGWTLLGEQMLIKPILANAATVRFAYLKDTFAAKADATPQAAFMADTDTFFLGDRLIQLGLQWYWKQQKGQPYAEDMASYETALAVEAGNDRGSGIITIGRPRMPAGVSVAYAGVLGP